MLRKKKKNYVTEKDDQLLINLYSHYHIAKYCLFRIKMSH